MKKDQGNHKKDNQDLNPSEYAAFLKNYDEPTEPQVAEDALYDTQLKSIVHPIATVLKDYEQGTVLDIGCGEGIMLTRLSKEELFKERRGWQYLGVDTQDKRRDILTLALELELELELELDINKRSTFLSLKDFYQKWIDGTMPQPLLVIIRNVFHELDIERSAELISILVENLAVEDNLVIQDLEVFPKSERKNVCWKPELFRDMLHSCGFTKPVMTKELTVKGNQWFNITAKRDMSNSPSVNDVREMIIMKRKQQFEYMDAVFDNIPDIQQKRQNLIAVLDFDLQYAALTRQLKAIANKPGNTPAELRIPPVYKKWLINRCMEMDISYLVGKAKESGMFFIKMPEIFIPLYADSNIKSESAKDQIDRESTDIEKLVWEKDYLIVKGQAGSGKTTFLKHLAYTIVEGKSEYGFKDYLPVLVLLNNLQTTVKKIKKDEPDPIADAPFAEKFLTKYFEDTGNRLNLETVKGFSENKDGKVIFLFDGLDEMEESIRRLVLTSLSGFRTTYPCKMVFTGRPSGINNNVVAQSFPDGVVEINNLNELQVKLFLKNWLVHDPDLKRKGFTSEGIWNQVRSHEYAPNLVETPLMLTAICVLYHNDGRLPDQEAELYESFINNLLFKRFESEEANRVRKFLMKLAFRVHSKGKERSFGRGLAKVELKVVYLKKDNESDDNYDDRLESKYDEIVQRCGLLRDEDNKYLFWHLMFQEYLTARNFSNFNAIKKEAVKGYWEKEWFKEAIRLFIGFLYCNNDSQSAKSVVGSGLNIKDSSPFMIWLLASQSLVDIPQEDRYVDGDEENVLEKAKEKLKYIIDTEADHRIKVDAGEILARLYVPEELKDLESFIPIKSDEYYLKGLGKKKKIKSFEICKYPVTNNWYAGFIKNDGYKNEKYWCKEGWKWLKDTKTEQPGYWNDRKWNCPDFPVVGVSWYEANAFSKWLTVSGDGKYKHSLLTEEEWEAAAAGRDGREYPWFGKWEKDKCNNYELSIGRTSPVGLFENGNTPEGVSDLSGNVWEWTSSWYNKDKDTFVLRGGSWFHGSVSCRCAYRSDGEPYVRNYGMGFRCARTLTL